MEDRAVSDAGRISRPGNGALTVTGELAAIGFDERGLVPVVVVDASDGVVLMLAYADREAVEHTITTGQAHYHSRSRGTLWRKGATSGNVVAMVLRNGLVLTVAALVVGLPLGIAASRLLASQLYEVPGGDPLTLALASLLLLGIALLATATPARRAARIDPVVLLRSE